MDFHLVNFSSKDGFKYNDKSSDVKLTGKSREVITVNLMQDTVLITRKSMTRKAEILRYPPIPLMIIETIDRESKGLSCVFEMKIAQNKLLVLQAKNADQKNRFLNDFVNLKLHLQKMKANKAENLVTVPGTPKSIAEAVIGKSTATLYQQDTTPLSLRAPSSIILRNSPRSVSSTAVPKGASLSPTRKSSVVPESKPAVEQKPLPELAPFEILLTTVSL